MRIGGEDGLELTALKMIGGGEKREINEWKKKEEMKEEKNR